MSSNQTIVDNTYNNELAVLAGIPIDIKGIKIYCPKLREIAVIGEKTYHDYLGLICFDITKLELDMEVDLYSFLLVNCKHDEQFRINFFNSFEFFTKEKLNLFFEENEAFFYVQKENEHVIIDPISYDLMVNTIKLQNGIKNDTSDDFKPKNNKAKEIAERLKKAKEKINKVKNKTGESLTLFDLVSSFSSNGNGMNILNVWDIDMYQFNNQFTRMQMIEEYEINIQSLLNGADSKEVKLKHYIRKINK